MAPNNIYNVLYWWLLILHKNYLQKENWVENKEE